MQSQSHKKISQVFFANEYAEGKGARVRRFIGVPNLQNLDPFLMLDNFNVKHFASCLEVFQTIPIEHSAEEWKQSLICCQVNWCTKTFLEMPELQALETCNGWPQAKESSMQKCRLRSMNQHLGLNCGSTWIEQISIVILNIKNSEQIKFEPIRMIRFLRKLWLAKFLELKVQ